MSIARCCLGVSERFCLFVGLISILLTPSSVIGRDYVLVDLTAVTKGGSGIAFDVNDAHLVVGVSFQYAARWERSGGIWFQQVPQSYAVTFANAVNNGSTAVGWGWQINAPFCPMIWGYGDPTCAPIPDALFYDINNSEQIVGRDLAFGSLIWEEPEVTYLGGHTAFGINDSSQVVGFTRDPNQDMDQAALWENIQGEWELTELGTLGGSSSWASDINDNSQIVGAAQIPEDLGHAFLWEDGVMTDLGTLGGSESLASDVNDLGQVVGTAMTVAEEDRAFLWVDGVMTDLNDLIVSETSLVLTEANAINDLGAIVGRADVPAGGVHAFLARPLRAGDLNLDAFVDAYDLALLLGSWGPCADCDDCPADLDNDYTVGPLDLAILLGNWG